MVENAGRSDYQTCVKTGRPKRANRCHKAPSGRAAATKQTTSEDTWTGFFHCLKTHLQTKRDREQRGSTVAVHSTDLWSFLLLTAAMLSTSSLISLKSATCFS